jgi:D-alanyl-D-alanine carboxypeptidase/D-alanyl-D-alanine-endopeptidase (penicillin-binding protein 4)
MHSKVYWQRLLLILLCAPSAAWSAATLPSSISQVINSERLPPNSVSFVIIDPDSGRVLLSQLPDVPRSPASTVKTLTTFAALDMLGPTYTWHTRAATRGTISGGVLDGDLILQGGGDPYITLERWWSFVQALRAKGLKSIRGDIVIDNSAFSLPQEDAGRIVRTTCCPTRSW